MYGHCGITSPVLPLTFCKLSCSSCLYGMKSWVISTVRLLSVRMLWRNASTWAPTQGLGLAQRRTGGGGALGSTDRTHRFHNVKLLPVLHLVNLVDILHWRFIEVDPLSVQTFISLESQQKQTTVSGPIARLYNRRLAKDSRLTSWSWLSFFLVERFRCLSTWE